MFWILGPAKFPDYPNYVRMASYGYESFFEFIPQYFLVSNDFILSPEIRVNIYFSLVHVATVFLFFIVMMLSPKASFMQALFFSYYLPFFLTTAARASLAYLIAGILVPILLAAGRRRLAMFCAVIACFFHDSGILPVLVLLSVYFAQYLGPNNIRSHLKTGVFVCFVASFALGAIAIEKEFFPDIGRFLDYLDGSLNSYPKLLFLYVHIFGVFIVLKKLVVNRDLELYFLLGSFAISLVALVNHVAALRLLPFIMGAGFLMMGYRLRVVLGHQIFLLCPFMLIYFYFNFVSLLRF